MSGPPRRDRERNFSIGKLVCRLTYRMPPEPRKPIEELLEASARARRAEFGADPKIPNPMRARLHDEIARMAREDEPQTPSRWMGMWWPRIAIGAAMAALVIGAPLVWWQ